MRARRPWLAVALAVLAAIPTARAEPVPVRAGLHDGYGRIVFAWPSPVDFTVEPSPESVRIRFGRPIEADFTAARRTLGRYLRNATVEADGRSVLLLLNGPWGPRAFTVGSSVVVDLSPAGDEATRAAALPSATPPSAVPAAPSVAPPAGERPPGTPEAVAVRGGEHEGYSRLVFDWNARVGYRVEQSGSRATVTFDRPASFDLQAVRTRPPRLIGDLGERRETTGSAISFAVPANARLRDFRSGNRVVVDVMGSGEPVVRQAETPAAPAPQPPSPPARGEAPSRPAVPPPIQAARPPAPAEPAARPVALTPRSQGAGGTAPPTGATPIPTGGAPSPTPGGEASEGAPRAPVKASATVGGQGVTLRFDWEEPVAAAIFRRASSLWVIFDKPTTVDTAALRNAAGGSLRALEQVPAARATALRFETALGVNPVLRRDGLAWLFDLRPQPIAQPTPIDLAVQSTPTGARLFAPVLEPSQPLLLRDPEVGDNLVVVPVIPLGHGMERERGYPQVDLLPTAQGLVIRPRGDDLRVRASRQGVEIAAAEGLFVSPPNLQVETGARVDAIRPLTRVFELEEWRRVPLTEFNRRRQEFQDKLIAAGETDRQDSRLKLARFYFAHAFAPETIAILDLMAETQPEIVNDPEYRMLRGASHFLMGHLDAAAEVLLHESLAANDEAALWRALVRAGAGGLVEAAPELRRTGSLIRSYPRSLKIPLALMIAESAIVTGDIRQAGLYLDVLNAEEQTPAQANQIQFVQGLLDELSGNFDTAVGKWEQVQKGRHPLSRARAATARVDLLMKLRRMSPAEAIEEMEKLRFAWRGDDFEFNLLRRLGELYLDQDDYRNGLRTLQQAATHFRVHPKAAEVNQQMADAFARLYLENAADRLPPVTAIALYDEFKELTPAGERGDEMIRRLADRLAAVDLLDRAAELLESQVQFRLRGVERARVAARLALVYLLDRRPQKAEEILAATQESGLPAELANQRRLLMARAMIDQGRGQDALALLKPDESRDADLLRLELFWDGQDWSNAAQVLRRLARESGALPGQPLNAQQAETVLRWAIALTLSGNERALDRLRRDYLTAMDATIYRDAFQLISTAPVPGLVDHRTVGSRVADAERFQGFMAAYRERVRTQSLSRIN